jgi:CBS-domain-containing membrane protein|tara:strand:+ start:194 stop:658 length:465 start_codon:yes stop_codon:yes gene_type:complete
MHKLKLKKTFFALIFSIITIGLLSFLTYKINLGVFLLASFGSTMVLLFGYPESPFAKPKNIFFGHILTSLTGIIFFKYISLPIFIIIPLAVGLGIAIMIFFDVTHPPAGGNPIIMISSSASFDFLFTPVITGTILVIIFGFFLNRFVAKNNYPS